MKHKVLTAVAFAVLLAGGTVTASAIAGKGPLSPQQTESTTTTTGSTTTGATTTTGTTTTGATTTTGTTTTTPSTTTAPATTTTTTTATTTTTTTTPRPRRITICHHVFTKKTTKHRTIRINRSAWKIHQKHGDSIGACNTATAKKFHRTRAHVKKFHHGRRR
jgi:hypothetical protein